MWCTQPLWLNVVCVTHMKPKWLVRQPVWLNAVCVTCIRSLSGMVEPEWLNVTCVVHIHYGLRGVCFQSSNFSMRIQPCIRFQPPTSASAVSVSLQQPSKSQEVKIHTSCIQFVQDAICLQHSSEVSILAGRNGRHA